MKFTKRDVEILKNIYNDADDQLSQELGILEKAASITRYTRYVFEKPKMVGFYEKDRISRSSAIRVLGREVWLSGIVRSAFHITARREADNGRVSILFFTPQTDN